MNRSQRVMLIALISVLLAAFALRLHYLGAQSLWYDETVSAHLATKSLGELIAHTARDIHPPLYYIVLHFWQALTGLSEFAFAFLSLFWGMLLLVSTATFARWLGGNHIALLTAALITLSPFNIWYSQEVRMYTLGATLGVFTLMALWQLMRGPRMKKRWMILWLFGAVTGLYTLYYFAFLLLWEALFVLWWLWHHQLLPSPTHNWRSGGEREGYWRRWVTLAILLVLLWAPWIPIAWRQATNPPVPPWRQGTSLFIVLLESMSALALGQSAEYLTIWPMILLLALLILFGLWLWWRHEQMMRQDSQSTLAPANSTNSTNSANSTNNSPNPLPPSAIIAKEGWRASVPSSKPLRPFPPAPLPPEGLPASFVLSHRSELFLLAGALLLPIAILILSSYTPSPLYHVRYVFTYSPVFYILLAMAFTGWMREANKWARLPGAIFMGVLLITPLLILSGESLQRFWHDTTYAADDLRRGVKTIEAQWRDDDVLLVNAGYTYPALNYYFDDPIALQTRLSAWEPAEIKDDTPTETDEGLVVLQTGSIGGDESLGWGLSESDFYAMTAEETIERLSKLTTREEGLRLWQFRLYDTVTDPDGLIRDWLAEHALLFHDQLLTGESNARVQGWLFPPSIESQPQRPIESRFFAPDGSGSPWIILHGADEPTGPRTGGSWVDISLWLEGHVVSDPDLRLSLGLFEPTPARRQWAVADEKPLGVLLSLPTLSGIQRWTVRLRLPQGIPPGKYDALLTFYRPADHVALMGEGEKMEANGQQVEVAVVEIGPTPPLDKTPQVHTPLAAHFGPLEFLGYDIPPGPWEPGASLWVELLWRASATATDFRAFVTSDVLLSDDGGIAKTHPPDQWRPGEVVRDVHHVTIAPNATAGDYPLYLRVGKGTDTIPWTEGLFRNGELLQLGTLTIKDRARTFEPPTPNRPLDIVFGESIQLIGINLPVEHAQPSHDIALALNWYAIVRPPSRYKIFTHLIGPDGQLSAQRDLEPGDGLLPTNGWARGEYVSTEYTISLPPDLPAGTYQLRVGLYDPITNERVLPIGADANGLERYVVLGSVEITP